MSLSSTSQRLPSLPLFLSLSIGQCKDKIPLSPEGLVEIIPVSRGRVEGMLRCHITDVANVKVSLMGLRLHSAKGRRQQKVQRGFR